MTNAAAELAQVRASITALEAQRSFLGDAVVDPALAALREKLAALEAQSRVTQQRKLVTVVFADVTGFTALTETMDAEVVAGFMNDLWSLVDRAITRHGGRIDKHIGDAVMALWGADNVREDDPEMAVRAALAMQGAIDDFCKDHSVPLAIRIGVNTGPALVGRVATTGEFTALGDTINLASRLEHAAPVGGVLISHDTYRQVRGVFDVVTREPILVKGKAAPVQTYLVLRAKPRSFRMATRGVEGVETRMVGRDREIAQLQAAYRAAIDGRTTQLITVIGEAGVGKSRLLYEFDNWFELQPEMVTYYKGRCTPNSLTIPFGLFRDLFAYRFEILDSDSAPVALGKFQAGMAGYVQPDQAAVTGHWLGFDFSASDAVSRLLGGSGFAETARAYLMRYFRGVLAEGPALIMLEDIHWSDEPSLDLVNYLTATLPAEALLVVAATRPSLFERRPGWGESEAVFHKIDLAPLSRHASRALVEEILQKVDDIPDNLRDLIVDSAEGNPFYVEEIIKMLIDQGVIERVTSYELRVTSEEASSRSQVASSKGQEASQEGTDLPPATRHLPLAERWLVRTDKLAGLKVPPTLIGLLQARLDRLPDLERASLQRASVIGRIFWDNAVADLAQWSIEDIRPSLDAAYRRELVFRRERSSFAEAEEYIFKHNLLRDVAYETVLLKDRIELHGRAARWLELHAGERIVEYLSLIAEHYILALEGLRAAAMLERSGYEAAATGSNRPAREALERALTLREAAGETTGPAVTRTLIILGQTLRSLGEFTAAEATLERAVAVARVAGDTVAEAEALGHLVFVLADRGRFDRAQGLAADALTLARATDGVCLPLVLLAAASAAWSVGDLDGAETAALEAIDRAARSGDEATEYRALNTLGNIMLNRRELERADAYYEAALAKARAAGNLSMEATLLINRGNNAYLRADYTAAQQFTQAARDRLDDLGERANMPLVLINLAQANLKAGDIPAAQAGAREALSLAIALEMQPMVMWAIFLCGQILVAAGKYDRGLALFGLARAQPAPEHQLLVEIDEEVAGLGLPPEQVETGLAAGAALDFDTVVQEILDGDW